MRVFFGLRYLKSYDDGDFWVLNSYFMRHLFLEILGIEFFGILKHEFSDFRIETSSIASYDASTRLISLRASFGKFYLDHLPSLLHSGGLKEQVFSTILRSTVNVLYSKNREIRKQWDFSFIWNALICFKFTKWIFSYNKRHLNGEISTTLLSRGARWRQNCVPLTSQRSALWEKSLMNWSRIHYQSHCELIYWEITKIESFEAYFYERINLPTLEDDSWNFENTIKGINSSIFENWKRFLTWENLDLRRIVILMA